jgi:uncharacterized membrane protein
MMTKHKILHIFWYIFLAFFSFKMLEIVFYYIPYTTEKAFLMIKQEYVYIKHWLSSFYLHVYTGGLVLFAGFTQFSKRILQQYPKLHKWAGRLYAYNVLFVTGPAAFIMSFYANGGLIGIVAFVLLSILWWGTTLYAILAIKKGNVTTHKNYMLRSYALALSAITLRIIKVLLAKTTHIPPNTMYQIISWAGWLINLLIIEVYIYANNKNKSIIPA